MWLGITVFYFQCWGQRSQKASQSHTSRYWLNNWIKTPAYSTWQRCLPEELVPIHHNEESEFKFWHQAILPLRSLIVSSDMGKLEKAPSFCSTGISYQRTRPQKSVTHKQVNEEAPVKRLIQTGAEAAKAWLFDQQNPLGRQKTDSIGYPNAMVPAPALHKNWMFLKTQKSTPKHIGLKTIKEGLVRSLSGEKASLSKPDMSAEFNLRPCEGERTNPCKFPFTSTHPHLGSVWIQGQAGNAYKTPSQSDAS